MKNWYKNWFDSPYYHLLYQHRDKTEAEQFIKKLIRSFSLKPNAKVLDLACGKGRHSIYLHQNGFDVTGTDLSEQNIKYANTFAKKGLHFAVHDMRYPIQGKQFDLIVNLFTSFGYFDSDKENVQVLDSVKTMLTNQSIFVLDFLNSSKINLSAPNSTYETENIVFKINKYIEDGTIVKKIRVLDTNLNAQFTFEEHVKAYDINILQQFFFRTGLEIIHTYGNYKLEPYKTNTSPRLIIIAKKTT